jgi:hypothetical protein
MLPYEPEPLERIQARFPKALEPIYDMRLVAKGWQPCPGALRPHVFDFDDGLRLIVIRERFPRRRGDHVAAAVHLHVSASFEPGLSLERDFKQRLRRDSAHRVVSRWFVPLVERRFAQFSGVPLVFHGLSPDKGVPHWFDAKLPKEVSDA